MAKPQDIRDRQPRVRRYDPAELNVGQLAQWEPLMTVSIILPAPLKQESLNLTLESLHAQSYPGVLIDVTVLEHAQSGSLSLPPTVPDGTRMLRDHRSSLASAAVDAVAKLATGDVVLKVRPDETLNREHVEAHMRWHHVADYLTVLGGTAHSHPVESRDAFRVAEHATISWRPDLYNRSGGLAPALSTGNDLELTYRLEQFGSVVIVEPLAETVGLEASSRAQETPDTPDTRHLYLANRVPLLRELRKSHGRQWKVPYIEVIIDSEGSSWREVNTSVSAALASTIADIAVTVVGPWDQPSSGSPAADRDDDLFLVQEAFGYDGRVRFVSKCHDTSAPAPFRFVCPAGLGLTPDGLSRLVEFSDRDQLGVVLLACSQNQELRTARFERTEAISRAIHLAAETEDLDDVIDEIFGTYWIDGTEWALSWQTSSAQPRTAAELQVEVNTLKQQLGDARKDLRDWKTQSEAWKKKAQIPLKQRLRTAVGHRLPALRRLRGVSD